MPSKTRSLIFQIPDWVDFEKTDIHLFYGREVIGRKLRGKPVEVKTVRCNLCGLCCSNLNPDTHFFGVKEDGTCEFLKFERIHHKEGLQEGWFCRIPDARTAPFVCCKGKDFDKVCCIRFEKVE
jgi:hypothetical protein